MGRQMAWPRNKYKVWAEGEGEALERHAKHDQATSTASVDASPRGFDRDGRPGVEHGVLHVQRDLVVLDEVLVAHGADRREEVLKAMRP